MFLLSFLLSLAFIRSTIAATAEEWRSRSIYQYAPSIFSMINCSDEHSKDWSLTVMHFRRVQTQPLVNPRTRPGTSSLSALVEVFFISCRCGGTWNTIRVNLDYIQNAGFTAVWISPINQNYEGPRSAYGDPYHGMPVPSRNYRADPYTHQVTGSRMQLN